MISKTLGAAALFALALAALPTAGVSGPFTDKMSACLVTRTTPDETLSLVRWIVMAYAQHPEVAGVVQITGDEEATNREVARIFSELMLDRCRPETEMAIKVEGQQAIEAAFAVLGQSAARGLITDPTVGQWISSFSQYVDQDAFNELLGKPGQ